MTARGRWLVAAVFLGVAARAGAASIEEDLASCARRALREYRHATGDATPSLAVWPIRIEERLDDRAKPFPFERGAERQEKFRAQREEDVRAVRAAWLEASGIDLAPPALAQAVAEEWSTSVRVVGMARVQDCLESLHAVVDSLPALSRADRAQLLGMMEARVVVRPRLLLVTEVTAWDWFEQRFLPVRMTLRPRIRFEFLDLEAATPLTVCEADLGGDLVYQPHAEILEVNPVRVSEGSARPRRYDLHVKCRAMDMMGRVVTVGFCMQGDLKVGVGTSLRWGPMDATEEEFDMVFAGIEEPPTRSRSRIDVRVYLAQGFGVAKHSRGPCELQSSREELAAIWSRVR